MEYYQLTQAEMAAIQQEVANNLRDPTSPIFGGARAVIDRSSDMVYVCGAVNGKNAFGAYVGAEAYMGALFRGQNGVSVFSVVGIGGQGTAQHCRQYGLL